MAALFRSGTSLGKLRQLSTIRLISTSKKNRETATLTQTPEQCKTTAEVVPVNKNWVSYGFDVKNEKRDWFATHSIFFMSVTVCLVFGGFVFFYSPDYALRDWAVREAFIELRRREANGLPLVDPNLIDPTKVQLPSDEELGETEIII